MNYIPLILLVVLVLGSGLSIYFDVMTLFMGLFFLIFSLLKLLDLPGFKKAFAKYDLLAGWFPFYGWVYPFIELALGFAFLLEWNLRIASIVTIIIMSFGSIGVFRALKKNLQCACLGTKIGVPLTHVTLFEDILMVAMAIMILL